MIRNYIRTAFFTALAALSFTTLSAQNNKNVGIGTTTPEPSAILDVSSPLPPNQLKGMLVPRMNLVQLQLFEGQYNDSLANGLIVYEEQGGNFWYYKYDNPVPATAPFGQWVMLASGTQQQNSNVPQGGIIMWSGTIASIPAGWSLCNGSNGTPDLTDKFIVSVASSAENPGTAPVVNEYVSVQNGSPTPPQRRFFKLAYIMKL